MKSMLSFFPIALAIALPGNAAAQDLCARIDQYVAPVQSLQVFSGVVLAAQGDRVQCVRAYGMASHEFDIAMRADHGFRIASISKPFTKVLIGVLAERGKLRLSDSIARWLPSFPSGQTITIQMLLDHRAGVPHVNSIPYDEESFRQNTLAGLVDSIAKMPLTSNVPGSTRRYSNGGYAVLARIVELIEGDAYGRVLDREVIQKLGLANTRHEADGDIITNLATGYYPAPDVFGVYKRAAFQQMDTKAGGGSLVSNARDMHRWMQAIGRAPIMSAAMWRQLFPTADSLVEFSGRNPGYNSYVVRDARSGNIVVVLANSYAASMVVDIGQAVVQLQKGDPVTGLPVRAPVAVADALLDRIVGVYQPPPGVVPAPPGVAIEIRRVGPSLVAYAGDVALDVLVPQGDYRFLARNAYMMIGAQDSQRLELKLLYRDGVFTAIRVK